MFGTHGICWFVEVEGREAAFIVSYVGCKVVDIAGGSESVAVGQNVW